MTAIVTTSCGYCGIPWELNGIGISPYVGPPIVKCASCGGLNKTKHKLFRDMGVFEKGWFYIRHGLIHGILMGSIVATGGVMIYGSYIERRNFNSLTFMISCLGAFFIYFGIKHLIPIFTLREITRIFEDIHDKNGGFVWSYEYIKFYTS